MDTDEFRYCLDILGWSQRHFAYVLDLDDGTARKWARGKNPIPEPVAKWLRTLAEAHASNPPPPPPSRRAE